MGTRNEARGSLLKMLFVAAAVGLVVTANLWATRDHEPRRVEPFVYGAVVDQVASTRTVLDDKRPVMQVDTVTKIERSDGTLEIFRRPFPGCSKGLTVWSDGIDQACSVELLG